MKNIVFKRKILFMGVAGSGKTTIGKSVSKVLGSIFIDADDFHSAEAVENMKHGIPLTPQLRKKWISSLLNHLSLIDAKKSVVVACSALKSEFQNSFKQLGYYIIFLNGDYDLLKCRLRKRKGHFFSIALLSDQFKALDFPKPDLTLDVRQSPEQLKRKILKSIENSE